MQYQTRRMAVIWELLRKACCNPEKKRKTEPWEKEDLLPWKKEKTKMYLISKDVEIAKQDYKS